MKKTAYLLLCIVTMATSCDDMRDFEPKRETINTVENHNMFILSEGLFNLNNSTLALYDFEKKQLTTDFFLQQNKRGLGDTANSMIRYGNKLYIIVNVSSQVEVLDLTTGKVIEQIPMFDDNKVARQPRYALAHHGKVYVTSFDGTLAKIDTTTLHIEALVRCGRNPEGLCLANGKIYVANSGGLDFPNYDNTLSVIDIERMQEIRKIPIEINPYKVYSDTEGDVYVSSRGNYGDKAYAFQRIDSQIDTVIQNFEHLNVLNFTIKEDLAYLYSYDFSTQNSWIKVFDCKTEQVIDDHFIKGDVTIQTPYSIHTSPYNDNVYISDALSYTVWGDLYCFDKKGKFQYKLTEVGLNPNTVVFSNKLKKNNKKTKK